MFITVRFDDRRELLNAKCRAHVLLEYIRQRCQKLCCEDDVLDLCDENGIIKNLRYRMMSYASEFLPNRSSYVLVKVETTSEGKTVCTALVNDPDFRVKSISFDAQSEDSRASTQSPGKGTHYQTSNRAAEGSGTSSSSSRAQPLSNQYNRSPV